MSELKITNKNFKQEVISSDIPVLIDFWASWCGPCKMLAPTIEELANELTGKVKVGKVNIDEEQELASKFNVMSIPTLIVFEKGKIKNSSVGLVSKGKIMEMLC